jgi:hypothetical protein
VKPRHLLSAVAMLMALLVVLRWRLGNVLLRASIVMDRAAQKLLTVTSPTSKRVEKGPAPLGSFVAQRPGAKDCVIATVATVTGLAYEHVARAFGIPVDQNGKPDAIKLGDGIKMRDTVIPLYRRGWVATPLLTREHPGNLKGEDWPSSNEIKTLVVGREAILSYIDIDEDVGPHSLAWNGREAVDCTDGMIVDLNYLTLTEALLLGRVQGANGST